MGNADQCTSRVCESAARTDRRVRSVIRHVVNWSLVVAQRATSYPPPPHRVTRVQDAPDHRAPIIETLEPVNLSDELDLVVAGVREHDMSPKVGTWSQLQTPRLRAKSSSTVTVLSYPIQSRLMGSSGPLRLRSASLI